MTSTKALKNSLSQSDADVQFDLTRQLTVSTMVKTMIEIIKIKKENTMDKETKKQFSAIAKEIILLAEQTQ